MENQLKNQKEIEQEMVKVNEQFGEFLHTKGITAKFKLAFENMAESVHKQREISNANFEAIKAQSEEENKEFIEFLHTKGFKAKFHLVIENIKKGAKEVSQKNSRQIVKVNPATQINIPQVKSYGSLTPQIYTAESLSQEFNAFLKAKGLDTKYTVVITEEQ